MRSISRRAALSPQQVLIVGAGAVGRVYGWALQRSGAQVSYYLKEKHAESARRGFALYWLNRDRRQKNALYVQGFAVFTKPEELTCRKWDEIYLTVSSPALRSGWLASFALEVSSSTKLISLQPGVHDRDYLLRYFSKDQLVSEMISIIAFESPENPGTTAFYSPPLASKILTLPMDARQLNKTAYFSAFLTVFVMALENAQWSFKKLSEPARLRALLRAARQTFSGVSQETKSRRPFALQLVFPFTLRLAIDLVPKIFPFDFEAYMRRHFTKVSDQTQLMAQDYVNLCIRHRLPCDAILNLKSGTPSEIFPC